MPATVLIFVLVQFTSVAIFTAYYLVPVSKAMVVAAQKLGV